MTLNVGTLDRVLRAVLGLILLYVAFAVTTSTLWTVVSAVAGFVLLLTAATRFCPAYTLFGIKTCTL